MQNVNVLEMTPEELRETSIKKKKFGKITLIIGVCTLPIIIGVVFLLLSAIFFCAANADIKMADSKEKEMNTPIDEYIIFDFETNGLSPKTNRVIEIGAIKIKDGNIVDTFTTLVNPQKNLTKKITDLTGITSEMLFDAPLENDAFAEFVEFIKGYILTAYNVNFDIGFLDETLKRIGLSLGEVEYFDTLKIARQEFSGLEDYKLETVARYLNPNFTQSHRALDDCYAIKNILDKVKLTKGIIDGN